MKKDQIYTIAAELLKVKPSESVAQNGVSIKGKNNLKYTFSYESLSNHIGAWELLTKGSITAFDVHTKQIITDTEAKQSDLLIVSSFGIAQTLQFSDGTFLGSIQANTDLQVLHNVSQELLYLAWLAANTKTANVLIPEIVRNIAELQKKSKSEKSENQSKTELNQL